MNLFVPKTKLVELNDNTAEAIRNATLYWLPVGYMAFIFVWVVCAAAILERQYIKFHISVLRKQGLAGVINRAKADTS